MHVTEKKNLLSQIYNGEKERKRLDRDTIEKNVGCKIYSRKG